MPKRHLSILNTESASACGPCGGKCCKYMPGGYGYWKQGPDGGVVRVLKVAGS